MLEFNRNILLYRKTIFFTKQKGNFLWEAVVVTKAVAVSLPKLRVSFCVFPHQLYRHHIQIQQMAGPTIWL